MELLEPRGWSPANSVETVIISIQSHLVIGKGRLHAVVQMGDRKKNQLLQKIKEDKEVNHGGDKKNEVDANPGKKRRGLRLLRKKPKDLSIKAGAYTVAEAKRSFQNILSIHKKEGWSKHWVKKG
jgi:acid phosphatase class B